MRRKKGIVTSGPRHFSEGGAGAEHALHLHSTLQWYDEQTKRTK